MAPELTHPLPLTIISIPANHLNRTFQSPAGATFSKKIKIVIDILQRKLITPHPSQSRSSSFILFIHLYFASRVSYAIICNRTMRWTFKGNHHMPRSMNNQRSWKFSASMTLSFSPPTTQKKVSYA